LQFDVANNIALRVEVDSTAPRWQSTVLDNLSDGALALEKDIPAPIRPYMQSGARDELLRLLACHRVWARQFRHPVQESPCVDGIADGYAGPQL
jgi:hypothetical protein